MSKAVASEFRHLAMFYTSVEEYLRGVLEFVDMKSAQDEPVFVAVPGERMSLIRDRLGARADEMTFADMTAMGRNPAWIIPAIAAFLDAHPGRMIRYVGEPIWAGRSSQEIQEATRHEALINLAFADRMVTILCPYDVANLDVGVLANAEHTHPELVRHGSPAESPAYRGHEFPGDCDQPLPPPPADAATFAYRDDLAAVRVLAVEYAERCALPDRRAEEFVLTVSELAANTLVHTTGPGMFHVWLTPHGVICQVEDRGHITDPLVGRRLPDLGAGEGFGLWLAHQLCDLAELRSTPSGTTVRLHFHRP
ncbi:MEDS domain-containing protein [Streptosporangiaceae bacterium NEAU-GS5]|nr:MEDS domain-containing protein [Streptosporangiaceae bacterium NEAU-GS5]